MIKTCFENVKMKTPLVHNITNYVTVNDVANVLLACGGSPIMADDIDDVEDITSICGGLNINIGTLNKNTIPSMLAAGKKANELGHAVLLDPVGVGASRLRTETAIKLLNEIKFDVIRGNISEIKTLAFGSGSTKGVDADVADAVTEDTLDPAVTFVKKLAGKLGCIIAVTGAIDLVADADTCYVIRNGRPEMGKITGTGCQLSGLMTAYLTANPDKIVFTGSYWVDNPKSVRLGYDATEEQARELMDGYLQRDGWSDLNAVKNGEVYAVHHGLGREMYDCACYEFFAKVCFPEEFSDLDPEATLKEYFETFLPYEYSGCWFVY